MTRTIKLVVDNEFFNKLSRDKEQTEKRLHGIRLSWESYLRVLYGLKNASISITIRTGNEIREVDMTLLGRKQ